MRVLLTGASGFIGSNVLAYWLEHTDHTFVCPVSFRHLGQGHPVLANDRVEVIYHDLRGRLPFIGPPCEIILNLASESHVDRSIQSPVDFIENNVSSTLSVLEYARRCPPKVFLHFSTDEVYGPHDHEAWDVLLPSNPYSASKACQEMIAISYWRTYGVPVVITNSNNIVGPNQDPEKFVPKVIDKIRRGEEVGIHVTKEGPGKRHYNPVQNVASALLHIVKLGPGTESDRPQRWLLPGGEELDNLDMANLIAKVMGLPLNWVPVDVHDIRPGYDQSYAPTHGDLPGWEPVISLEACLKGIVDAGSVDSHPKLFPPRGH